MKVNSAFFYSLFALSISQLTMSVNAYAKKQVADERWFEVEVILFQQLGDKTAFKEQFPEGTNASNLPNYDKYFDLLGSYIQPDLRQIKQFLPQCTNENKANEQPLLLQPFNSISAAFNERLQQIEKIDIFELSDIDAQKRYTMLDLQTEELAQPLFDTEVICVISQQTMEQLFNKEQLDNININSIDIDSLPNTLNALGEHNEKNPYLIADEYLLLNDISQRLRWSKEFKPLLHFGWRQTGVTQRSAIPLKLFAGQSLTYEYKKALTDYQAKTHEEDQLETNLLDRITNTTNVDTNSQLEIKTKKQQQVLEQLFARFDLIHNNVLNENTIDETVKHINEQDLEAILTIDATETMVKDPSLSISHPPTKPLQPWFLDGFIKIHLDHYLYITADFNLVEQNDVKEVIKNTNKAKLVNFSQDRRVITGEIHYFDHPYIGMVVQIRRFDPTKPEGEQISQSIK